jgi:membrane associated rhomboid family serine protease
MKAGRESMPSRAPRIGRILRRTGQRQPVITYGIMAICIIVYLLQQVTGGIQSPIYQWLAYYPPLTATEPWRMLTAAFVHSPQSILHIAFNMYSLYIFGPMLENMLGRARYIALFLITALGSSVAVLLLAPTVVVIGASGAIYGLLGAYFVIARRLGANSSQLLIVIALNLGLSFVVPGIAWQAHIGGLITGAALALIFMATRHRSRHRLQVAGLAGVTAILVAITAVAIAV